MRWRDVRGKLLLRNFMYLQRNFQVHYNLWRGGRRQQKFHGCQNPLRNFGGLLVQEVGVGSHRTDVFQQSNSSGSFRGCHGPDRPGFVSTVNDHTVSFQRGNMRIQGLTERNLLRDNSVLEHEHQFHHASRIGCCFEVTNDWF
jgi:hypothetical protein